MKYWFQCLGLAALIGLLNYYPLPFFPTYEQILLPLVSFFLALILGVRFPDIDLFTPGLKHRSAITHSVLLPWLMTLVGYPAIVSGLAMGMAIHMLADIFPKAWIGGALIKMPFFGSLGRLSPFWLMFNCLACLALGLQTTSALGEWVAVGGLSSSLLIMIWYFLREEKSMPPLLAGLMIISALFWSHYNPDFSLLSLIKSTGNTI
ncbi:MAG: hypothetical protein PUP46_08155 [Endozoicomonas sp. (ex Botrylloides leachii)]|nr:hypothetical protein [Endozoicomonas sp. (ex Botrylloides leachii)]